MINIYVIISLDKISNFIIEYELEFIKKLQSNSSKSSSDSLLMPIPKLTLKIFTSFNRLVIFKALICNFH
jgi:hypothetical protein